MSRNKSLVDSTSNSSFTENESPKSSVVNVSSVPCGGPVRSSSTNFDYVPSFSTPKRVPDRLTSYKPDSDVWKYFTKTISSSQLYFYRAIFKTNYLSFYFLFASYPNTFQFCTCKRHITVEPKIFSSKYGTTKLDSSDDHFLYLSGWRSNRFSLDRSCMSACVCV